MSLYYLVKLNVFGYPLYGDIGILLLMIALACHQYNIAIAILVLSLFANYIVVYFGETKYSMSSVSFSVFGLLYYIGMGMTSLLLIRHDSIYMNLSMPFELYNWGTITLWLLLFTTWASDTFAYFQVELLVNVK